MAGRVHLFCVMWQVTQWDPIWQVTPRSSENDCPEIRRAKSFNLFNLIYKKLISDKNLLYGILYTIFIDRIGKLGIRAPLP